MKTQLITGLILVLLGLFSCKKGDTGAQGAQGEQGIPGAQGIQGIKGIDGSTILSGTVVPLASLGKVGDFYFRTSTADMYGPKTAAGWGTPKRIKGENGVNGTNGVNGKDGSQFLSGNGFPAVSLGKVGDFYFNTGQMVLYGPKISTGWGVGTNLRADAKVFYSGWKNAVRLKDSIIDGTTMRIGHIYAPSLTASIINNSAILMYLDFGGGNFALPYTSRASGRMSTITFKLKTNEIVVYRFVYDGGALINLGGSINFRYVIIPGNTYLGMKKRNIDIKDPLAVEEYLEEHQQE